MTKVRSELLIEQVGQDGHDVLIVWNPYFGIQDKLFTSSISPSFTIGQAGQDDVTVIFVL